MKCWAVALLAAVLAAAACAAPAPRPSTSERLGVASDGVAGDLGGDAVVGGEEAAAPSGPADRSPPPDALDGGPDCGALSEGDDEAVDDGIELPQHEAVAGAPRPPHPLQDLSDEELGQRLREDPESLGSMSLGKTSGGALFNGVKMPDDDRWEIVDRPHSWGTEETVGYITRAVEAVHAQFPETPKLYIGDLSRERGGRLAPHISHRSGRDVDLSFYYTKDARWYLRARADNLDVPRTWALVKAMVTETDVELILLDRRVQGLLYSHALATGEDRDWLDGVFHGRGPDRRALIRHARGHATHLHVRFFNPIAQETGRRAYPMLVKRGLVKAPSYFVSHRVRKGQTLRWLARRYGTTVRAIRRANRIRGTRIRAGRVYRIPRKGGVAPVMEPVVVPPRRLPPTKTAEATSDDADAG